MRQPLQFFLALLHTLALSGCAAPRITPTDAPLTLQENEGIVVSSMVINRSVIKPDGTSESAKGPFVYMEYMTFSVNGGRSVSVPAIQINNEKRLQIFHAPVGKYYSHAFHSQGILGGGEFATVKANFSILPGKITYIGTLHLNIVTTKEKGSWSNETTANLEVINDVENVRAEIEKKYPGLRNELVANLAEVTKNKAPVYPPGLYFLLKESKELNSD